MKLRDIIGENFLSNLARSDGAFFTGMRRRNAPKPIVTPKKQKSNKKKKKDKTNATKRRTRSKRNS